MAKKATTRATAVVEEKPPFIAESAIKAGEKAPAGYKRCPKDNGGCGGYVRGPQTKVCPKEHGGCGYTFELKKKGGANASATRKGANASNAPQTDHIAELRVALRFAEQLGNGDIAKAKAAAEQLRDIDVDSLISSLGEWEEKAKAAGGLNKAKASFELWHPEPANA